MTFCSCAALNDKRGLDDANVTHILSVVSAPPKNFDFAAYQHLCLTVDDMESEDIIQHFPVANDFVSRGLQSGGSVLIHCDAGRSRSVAFCISYLISGNQGAISPTEALAMIQKSRPESEPNEGFMWQLELYHVMGCPEDVARNAKYQKWLYERTIEENAAYGRGPEEERVLFEDEHATGTPEAHAGRNEEIRCRKCRYVFKTVSHWKGKRIFLY